MEPLNILKAQLLDMARSAIEIMPQLLIALTILVLTYAFAKLAKNIAKRILAN